MTHGYPGEADTAAYLTNNWKSIEPAKEPPADPVDALFGGKQFFTNSVTTQPKSIEDSDVSPVMTIGQIFGGSNVLTLLGDLGLADVLKLYRGMRIGNGNYPAGYNPFYNGAIKDIEERFNGRMEKVIEALKAARAKGEEKKSPADQIKKAYNDSLLNNAARYLEGVRAGIDFYKTLPPGSDKAYAERAAASVLSNHDGATYSGALYGIELSVSGPARARAVGGRRINVTIDEAVAAITKIRIRSAESSMLT